MSQHDGSPALRLLGLRGLPEIGRGDDLARLIAERASLEDGDVVVVTQKIVSKAEGRLVAVDPGSPRERQEL
ncbi:MAG: coenzyme F420-0:L-glutamate ligase, partial [Actinomycetota bacterium]|nr:coenzyme F420-0:L-glutamate ligase [Actinomycetota bacterium]